MRKRRGPDADSPEMGPEFFAHAVPLDEAPPHVAAAIRRFRGPQKTPTKRLVSLRLDRVILEAYRASGKGWQSRINATLAMYIPQAPRKRKRKPQRKSA